MRPRISITKFVRSLVGPSVRPSVRWSRFCKKTRKLNIFEQIIVKGGILDIIQSFHYHEDASLALWALFRKHYQRTDGPTRTHLKRNRWTNVRTNPLMELFRRYSSLSLYTVKKKVLCRNNSNQ